MDLAIKDSNYQSLLNQISSTYLEGQKKAVLAVNSHLVETYWQTGQYSDFGNVLKLMLKKKFYNSRNACIFRQHGLF